MDFPDENESEILLRSILDINMAKLLKKDIPLFREIISDLFPNIKLSISNHESLVSAAMIVCKFL